VSGGGHVGPGPGGWRRKHSVSPAGATASRMVTMDRARLTAPARFDSSFSTGPSPPREPRHDSSELPDLLHRRVQGTGTTRPGGPPLAGSVTLHTGPAPDLPLPSRSQQRPEPCPPAALSSRERHSTGRRPPPPELLSRRSVSGPLLHAELRHAQRLDRGGPTGTAAVDFSTRRRRAGPWPPSDADARPRRTSP